MLRREAVPITSPCEEDWDAMEDRGRFRMCARCNKPVHDLAQYTEREILEIVAAGACKRVSIYEDGTIATKEAAVVPVSRLARFARAAAIALPLAACNPPGGSDQLPGATTAVLGQEPAPPPHVMGSSPSPLAPPPSPVPGPPGASDTAGTGSAPLPLPAPPSPSGSVASPNAPASAAGCTTRKAPNKTTRRIETIKGGF